MPKARSQAEITMPTTGTKCNGVRATKVIHVNKGNVDVITTSGLTLNKDSRKSSRSKRSNQRLVRLWGVIPLFDIRLPKVGAFASGDYGLVVHSVARYAEILREEEREDCGCL